MKRFSSKNAKFLRLGFALSLYASCGLHVSAAEVQDATPKQAGVLYLYNKQHNLSCSFIASDGQYAFQNGSGQGCPNDTIYYWRIYQGAPGTIITFKDSSNCTGSEPSYSFRLTGSAGSAVTMPEGVFIGLKFTGGSFEDVVSGVQTYSHGVEGTMVGKLSCVNIWR